MKKTIQYALLSSTLIFLPAAFSQTNTQDKKVEPAKPIIHKKEQTKSADSEKSTQLTQINLFASPESNAKIIKQLPADARLVQIYRKGDWIKVGDTENGETGWINIHQYNEARSHFYQEHFYTHFTSVSFNWTKDKNGKTVIEGYQNGKKLSETEAKKLYEQVQQQEQKQWEAMQRFNHIIDQQFQYDFSNMPTMMPGIVVIQQPIPSESSDKNKPNSK